MFRAVRLAPSSNSVDPVSREALYRSQAARLTRVSRLDSPKPTDNLPFLPRAITHALWVEPSGRSHPRGLQLPGKRAGKPELLWRVLGVLGAGGKSGEPEQRHRRCSR